MSGFIGNVNSTNDMNFRHVTQISRVLLSRVLEYHHDH